ncbi:MAG: tRNA epoxyqueuosine(34) reductase QueG [Anaerolineaceae bacterium 4572_32.2]|nr:MAG: tRNA epoxyqueuosine(34) reductase QueG [Anaerolineaceae bacterium 4572_32.2]
MLARSTGSVKSTNQLLTAHRGWAILWNWSLAFLFVVTASAVQKAQKRLKPLLRTPISSAFRLNYYTGPLPDDLKHDHSRGLISNYAWGLDYHDLMLDRLEELATFIAAEARREIAYRAYVDTGPLLERAYAAEAGLGFTGKNTCLIHPQRGSWLFLGEILLDIALEPTLEKISASCGTCTRCLGACPTGALVAPYVLDARRCISYLTIELKGPIPRELRPLMGNHIFGCDVCQIACPWQRFARPTKEAAFWPDEPDRAAPLLLDLMALSEGEFCQRYEGTPILRTGRGRLLRNAAVALGNWGDERAIPALTQALSDAEPLARGHAAWALGRVGGRAARRALEKARQRETDSYVRQEIQIAVDPQPAWSPATPPGDISASGPIWPKIGGPISGEN